MSHCVLFGLTTSPESKYIVLYCQTKREEVNLSYFPQNAFNSELECCMNKNGIFNHPQSHVKWTCIISVYCIKIMQVVF